MKPPMPNVRPTLSLAERLGEALEGKEEEEKPKPNRESVRRAAAKKQLGRTKSFYFAQSREEHNARVQATIEEAVEHINALNDNRMIELLKHLKAAIEFAIENPNFNESFLIVNTKGLKAHKAFTQAMTLAERYEIARDKELRRKAKRDNAKAEMASFMKSLTVKVEQTNES